MAVSKDGFAVVGGEPRKWTKTADSGKPSHQYWCAVCHGWTHTIAEGSPGMVVVRASTLDHADWVRPVGQIFLRSAYPWVQLSVSLSYEEEFEDTGPLKSAFACSDIRMAGTSGIELLDDPVLNKGTAFTTAERREHGLEGLLPATVKTIERQLERVMGHLEQKPSDLECYVSLMGLCDRNEPLFYKTLMSDPARFVPIVPHRASRLRLRRPCWAWRANPTT